MHLPLLHATTSFLAATLLFAVQPWAAKQLLPQFGGSASVWLTTLLFFQAAVFVGTLYAHQVSRAPRFVHAVLYALAVLLVPLGFHEVAVDAAESLRVLLELALAVGVIVVLLSATTPLVQRWLAGEADRPRTFALYAASNAGSLFGLLAYPVVVEPWIGLDDQSRIWHGVALMVAVLLVAVAVRGAGAAAEPGPSEAPRYDDQESSPRTWFLLAFVPASLLYGFTAFVTRDIAAVPLLWVVPLGLYLVTFVVAFAGRGRRLPGSFQWVGPLLLYATALVTVVWPGSVATLALHLIAFVAFAAYFHGELSAARPSSTGATRFYLWVSLAGLAAGMFNALLAPVIFDAPLEYALTYGLALVALPAAYATQLSPTIRRVLHGVMMIVLAVAFFVAPGGLGPKLGAASLMAAAFFGALAFPALSHIMLAMFLGAVVTYPGDVVIVERSRSFYGSHTVEERVVGEETYLALAVGLTQHGIEAREGPLEPLGYYHASGPCGEVFAQALDRSPAARIAVVGLGVGSMALYTRPDDRITFFELDPSVVRLAHETFRTLGAARGTVDVRIADGRRGLLDATEAFDLIVIDAFSSDAIPTHLLTREAIDVYARKLSPHGLLLVHTSNRYLDVDRVVIGALETSGWSHRQRLWSPGSDGPTGAWPSSWVVAAPPGSSLGALGEQQGWQVLRSEVVWTDDYSSLLPSLR